MAEEKLQRLYDLIDEIETAMFTTRRPDGHLVSRPMAVQKRAAGADLWFITMRGSHKLDEIANDAHVNLAFYKDRTREWVSASGRARVPLTLGSDVGASGGPARPAALVETRAAAESHIQWVRRADGLGQQALPAAPARRRPLVVP